MLCKNCGTDIPESAKFCPVCGTAAVAAEEKQPETEVVTDVVTEPAVEQPEAAAEAVTATATEKEPEIIPEPVAEIPEEKTEPKPEPKPEPVRDKKPETKKEQTYRIPDPEVIPDKKSPYYTLSVGQWFWTLLLLMIPVVNVVVWLVWLFGGSRYRTRTNFVRGQLVLWLVFTMLTLAACIVLIFAFPEIWATVVDFINSYRPMPLT